jgi:hypothetical protein
MNRRLIFLLLTLVVLVAGLASFLLIRQEEPDVQPGEMAASGTPGLQPTELEAPEEALQPALADTIDAGPFRVTIEASVSLPEQVSAGVPARQFQGRGFFDPATGTSEIAFDFSEVPNGFGVLGHVNEVEVIYSEGAFSAGFDRLPRLLDGANWMGFEFPVFYSVDVAGDDNGQLRELGLTDPSVGFALLEGASDLSVDVAVAADASGSKVLEYLSGKLRVEEAKLTGEVDDGIIRQLQYQLRYPPLPVEDDPVVLTVLLELVPTDSKFDVQAPAAGEILPYEEFVKNGP